MTSQRRESVFVASAVLAAIAMSAVPPHASAQSTLATISSLSGDWEGTFEWSGARHGSGSVTAHYFVTGGGSAVVENLTFGGKVMMTSVYHTDDVDLRMTHFCASGNQPRLRASGSDIAPQTIRFRFVDVTNLASASAGHLRGVEMRLGEAGRLTLLFTYVTDEEESVEKIELVRSE